MQNSQSSRFKYWRCLLKLCWYLLSVPTRYWCLWWRGHILVKQLKEITNAIKTSTAFLCNPAWKLELICFSKHAYLLTKKCSSLSNLYLFLLIKSGVCANCLRDTHTKRIINWRDVNWILVMLMRFCDNEFLEWFCLVIVIARSIVKWLWNMRRMKRSRNSETIFFNSY